MGGAIFPYAFRVESISLSGGDALRLTVDGKYAFKTHLRDGSGFVVSPD